MLGTLLDDRIGRRLAIDIDLVPHSPENRIFLPYLVAEDCLGIGADDCSKHGSAI